MLCVTRPACFGHHSQKLHERLQAMIPLLPDRLSDEPGTLGLSYCAAAAGPPGAPATVRHQLLAAAAMPEAALAAAVMALPHARHLLDPTSRLTVPKVLSRHTPLGRDVRRFSTPVSSHSDEHKSWKE